MNNNFLESSALLTIQEAAKILGVSTKTLRRWDKAGILVPNRTVGNQRRYSREKIDIFTRSKTLLYSPSVTLQGEEALKTEKFGRFLPSTESVRGLPKASPIQIAVVASGACIFLILLGIHIGANILLKSDIGKIVLGSAFNGVSKLIENVTPLDKGLVLGEATSKNTVAFNVNASSSFNNSAAFLEGIMAAKIATLSGGIITEDQDIDAGTGTLTASNVLYGATAGSGISVGTGQNPTITNTDLGSSQNIFKTIKVGSDSFSSGSNTDTLEFASGTGISLSADKSNKKLTITGSATSGWTDDGTAVRLTTSTDSVGIGTTSPSSKLDSLSTTEQLRLLYDSSNYTSFTVSSSGDITLNPTGGDIIFADADVLNIGGSGSDTAYNIIGDSSSGASGVVDSDDDLYIEGNIEVDGTVRLNNVSYTFPSADGSNTYVMQTNGSGALSWIDPGTLPSTNFWDRDNGAIYPKIATVLDFFVGGTATSSAKFAALNINSGTPTASVSAGTAGGAYLNATGTLSTTAMQTLTLGGSTTGNITIDSGTSSITLSDDTTISGDLAVNGATSADITSTTTTGTLFNTTVTTLSLGGAATTLNLGTTDSVTRTINLGTGSGADTINIGTGATTANTINVGTGAVANTIAIGSSSTTGLSLTDDNWSISTAGLITTADDLAVNGADITTSASTFNLVNATATTVNFAGAATTISVGASTGTTTVNNALTVTGAGTFNNTFTNTNGTSSNSVVNLTSTGDLVLQDNGSTVVTFTDAGLLTLAAQAPTDASNFIAVTNTAGAGTGYDLLDISLTSASDDAGADTQRAAALTITGPTDTEDTTVGLAIVGGTASGGTEVAIDIPAITAGAGTETAIRIGSGWDTVLDSNALDISGAGVITGATGISSSGTITLSGLTASRFVVTDSSSNLISTAASSVLLDTLSDETGTGVAVFGTSPTITTSLVTDSTTFALANTTATTINFAGAATTALNIGNGSGNYTDISLGSGSGTHTINIAGTGATGADTINIGTGGTGADTITIGNSGSTTSLALTSGTGAQTFTSSATTGTAFSFVANSITSGNGITVSATGVTTGEILDLTGTWAPTDGSINEAIDINITHTPTTSADNFRGMDLDISDGTALGNTVYNYDGTLTLTGNAAKTGYGIYQTVTSNSTTADTIYSLYAASSVTGAISSGTRNTYGFYSNPAQSGGNTGGTSNLYGGYFAPSSTSSTTGSTVNVYGSYISNTGTLTTGGTINSYGLYVANGSSDATGTSTKYGIYVESPTGADTNYAAIFAGGNVGIGTTSPDSALDIDGGAGDAALTVQGNKGDINLKRAGSGGGGSAGVTYFESGTQYWYAGIRHSSVAGMFEFIPLEGGTTAISLDPRTTTSGVSLMTLGPSNAPTIASAATAEYTSLTVTPPTITLTGTTQVTSQMDSLLVNAPTITDASAITVDDAATLTIAGAPITGSAGSVTISDAYGLKINTASVDAGTGTVTRAYGLYVDAPTGAGTNYAAAFATGNVGIGDATPDNALDLNSTATSGNIFTVGADSAVTLAGLLTGTNIDLSTNYTATNQSQTALDILLDGQTNTDTSGTDSYKGIEISGTALTQNGTGGTSAFKGIEITIPAITQTAGTITAAGLEITTGTITTGGTQRAIYIAASGVGAGTLNGISIPAITGGAGTERAIYIDVVGWDAGIYMATSGSGPEMFFDGNSSVNFDAQQGFFFDLDDDNNGDHTFTIRNGGDTNVFRVWENGDLIQSDGTTTASKTTGFLSLNTTAGAPTGAVTNYTGLAAMTYDITNNKLCMRDGSSWLCSGALTDIAEWVPAPGVEGGDLIAVTDQPNPIDDPTAPTVFAKTTTAYDPKMAGVISQYAEEVGSAQGYKLSEDYHAMTLVGRVPVKVSLENGPIAAGDYLTSSLIPGVAMRATKPGRVIGMALESFDGQQCNNGTIEQCKVMVFINPHWSIGAFEIAADGNIVQNTQIAGLPEDQTIGLDPLTSPTASDSASFQSFLKEDTLFKDLLAKVGLLETRINNLVETSLSASTSALLSEIQQSSIGEIGEIAELKDATVSGTLNVLGRTTLTDVGVTGNINAGLLSINGLDEFTSEVCSGSNASEVGTCTGATINTLSGNLYLQNQGLGGVDILNGKITIDTKGNVKISGDINVSGNIEVEGTVTAEKINIDTKDKASTSIGNGVIEVDKTFVAIPSTSVTANSKIFVTATSTVGKQSLFVKEKTAGIGFTVAIEKAYNQDITFDWWIVN